MSRSSLIVLTAAGVLAMATGGAKTANQPKPMQISIARTFVPDQPKIFVEIAAAEFSEVFTKMTGLTCEMSAKYNPGEIADKLAAKQMDFGMLYAHEFAWARKKYPELQPLLIAATKKKDKRAHVIVHKNNPIKSIADLCGKKLDLPLRTKEYCRLYLEKVCSVQAQKLPTAFFGSVAKSESQFAALDQVARGDAQVTVIDTPWLDYYKDVKGAVFEKNLRILQQSEVVPPAFLVYRKGTLAQATLDQVSDGLRKAHRDGRGRALMKLWHIDAFEPVPSDYEKSLERLLKEYPVPEK